MHREHRLLGALVALVALSACGGARERTREPRRESAASIPTSETIAPASSSSPTTGTALDQAVTRALEEAARLRELPAKGPVKGVELTRAEMAERVRSKIEKEVPTAVLQGEAESMIALGLVPVEFDYVGMITRLYRAELAGFYEPKEKALFLDRKLRGPEREAALSHELVHALQDQHFDLQALMDYRPGESDRLSAIHALAEGDAMSAMIDQVLLAHGRRAVDVPDEFLGTQVRASAALNTEIADAPAVLVRSLIAPYVDGVIFVNSLRRAGGWGAVDHAWKRPPASTEQILHPEKFESAEAPLAVPDPAPPAGFEFRAVHSDVVGEESIRSILEEWLPRAAAVEAAAGWGGDRYSVFRDGDTSLLLWHLAYDDAASAKRAEAGFVKGLGKQGTAQRKGSDHCVERADRGPLLVHRNAQHVVIVGGPFRRSGGKGSTAGTCDVVRPWARALASFK